MHDSHRFYGRAGRWLQHSRGPCLDPLATSRCGSQTTCHEAERAPAYRHGIIGAVEMALQGPSATLPGAHRTVDP